MFTDAIITRTDYDGRPLEVNQLDISSIGIMGIEDIKNLATDHNKSHQDGYCYIIFLNLDAKVRFIYAYELQDGYIVNDLTPKYLFQ